MKRKHTNNTTTTTEPEDEEVKGDGKVKNSDEVQPPLPLGSSSLSPQQSLNAGTNNPGSNSADDDVDDDELVEMPEKIPTSNATISRSVVNDDDDDDDDEDDDADEDLMGLGCSAAFQYAPGVLGLIPVEDQIKFSGLLCSQKQVAPAPLAKYRLLGSLCFGSNWAAMTGQMRKKDGERIFDLYVNSGGNFIDTALNYQDGQSVEWLGEWITKRGIRDKLILSAKYSLPTVAGDINAAGNHRKSLFHAVDATLQALNTNYIDILFLHVWDFTTPPEEIMRGLDDLVKLGKVHYIGVSDTPAWVVARANTIANLRGWTPFIAYQGKYNPAERDVEMEILPMCREMGIGLIPWGIYGWCNRYQRETVLPPKHESDGPHAQKIDLEVISLAKQYKKTPAQVVLNWALQRSGVTSALLNCRSVEDIEEAIGSLDFEISKEHLAQLDAVAYFAPGYPYKYIGNSYQSSPWFRSAGIISTHK